MKRDQIMAEYSQNSRFIKEANEICKMLGKNISFKQIIVQNFEDELGRKTFFHNKYNNDDADDFRRRASSSSIKINEEEMNIQVRNHDKNTTVMWSEETFLDRLEMMRDALNHFEDSKHKAHEKQLKREQERQEKIMV